MEPEEWNIPCVLLVTSEYPADTIARIGCFFRICLSENGHLSSMLGSSNVGKALGKQKHVYGQADRVKSACPREEVV